MKTIRNKIIKASETPIESLAYLDHVIIAREKGNYAAQNISHGDIKFVVIDAITTSTFDHTDIGDSIIDEMQQSYLFKCDVFRSRISCYQCKNERNTYMYSYIDILCNTTEKKSEFTGCSVAVEGGGKLINCKLRDCIIYAEENALQDCVIVNCVFVKF